MSEHSTLYLFWIHIPFTPFRFSALLSIDCIVSLIPCTYHTYGAILEGLQSVHTALLHTLLLQLLWHLFIVLFVLMLL